MGEIFALAIKDLRVISHDKAAVFFLFFFPIAIAIFFGTIFGGAGEGPRQMTIAIVDQDDTAASRAFVESLGSEEGIVLDPKTEEEARTAVRRGWVGAYILLPEGYGEAEFDMFRAEGPGISMGIDPSRQAEGAMIKGLLMKHNFVAMQERFRDRSKLREMFDGYIAEAEAEGDEQSAQWVPFLRLMGQAFENMPEWDEAEEEQQQEAAEEEGEEYGFSFGAEVETEEIAQQRDGPRSSYETSFPQGMLWALLTSAAAFGLSLVTERTRGTLVRLRITPLTRAHILAGKGLACFMAMISVTLTLSVVGVLAFGIRPSSYLHLAMAVLCGCICFVGMMMFVSVLGKTEQSAGGFGWAIMITMGMIGGASIPLFFMPPWLQKVSTISPVRWAALALEGSLWRGFSFTEMLLPCGVLVGIGVGFFCIGARAFKWIQE
jgi:ABC-2 type transport system permease protein